VHKLEITPPSNSNHLCYGTPEAKEQTVSVSGLGKVLIRVHVAEGLPKKVCIIRNGMVITDSLENFGDRFSRFAMYRDFVAIVVPIEQEGRTLIKRLENPRHDGLSAERLSDDTQRARSRNIMKRLARTIRDTIKSYTLVQFDKEMAVDEMRHYFAAESAPQDRANKSEQEDPNTLRYKVEPRRPRSGTRATATGPGTTGGQKPGQRPGPGPGPGPGTQPRPRQTGTGTGGTARSITLADVRNVPRPGKGGSARSIFFTPNEGGMATIILEASGMNESEELQIVAASESTVKGGHIWRRLNANERTRIDVEFSESYTGPIELRASIEPDEAANET
jgi:hypothetical protein